MSARARVPVLLAATLLTACVACGTENSADSDGAAGNNGDSSAASATAPMTTVAAPSPLLGRPITDSEMLFGAMLGADDVPPGFTQLPDPVRDLGMDPAPEYDAADRSSTTPSACAGVLGVVASQLPGASADAEVRYSGPNFSSLDEDAASYPDQGAADAFAAVQQTFQQCGSFSGTDADGIAVEYTLTGRDQTTIGDASTAVRLTISSEGFTLISDAIVAVVDSTVMQLVATDQTPVDASALTDLATRAAEKIRGATPDA